jgi:hypothetical protein
MKKKLPYTDETLDKLERKTNDLVEVDGKKHSYVIGINDVIVNVDEDPVDWIGDPTNIRFEERYDFELEIDFAYVVEEDDEGEWLKLIKERDIEDEALEEALEELDLEDRFSGI